jgi:NAD(P)H-dependent flavin oxidoreductase YrpB (nitropropane dioxygenase family)
MTITDRSNFLAEFGISVPLIQGPMGGVSGPRLVAAVANSGALGVLPIWADSLADAQSLIEQTQLLTSKAFAVNLRADLKQLEHIAMAADMGVKMFHLFWGDPSDSAASIRAKNAHFLATVGDREAAVRALDAGASAIVAQGVEAGGHVLSETSLPQLLSNVLSISDGVPVIAAGGITDLASAQVFFDMGASGVLCGSRFVASEESEAHEHYKAEIVDAGSNSTVRSLCFDLGWPDAPHRTLVNSTYQMWKEAGFPKIGERPGEGDTVLVTEEGVELPRYFVMPPKKGMSGDILAAATYAGEGVSRINAILPAASIVEEFSQIFAE